MDAPGRVEKPVAAMTHAQYETLCASLSAAVTTVLQAKAGQFDRHEDGPDLVPLMQLIVDADEELHRLWAAGAATRAGL